MCGGKSRYVKPNAFKDCLAYINPRFAGFDQNDAAICFSTILSEIHNEMNIISNPKPYYPCPPNANELGEAQAAT